MKPFTCIFVVCTVFTKLNSIECAGVHRSIPNISKVRSIQLDKWNPKMIENFLNCGDHKGINEKFNQSWEYFVDTENSDFYKPVSNSRRILRRSFIIAKYQKQLFHKKYNSDKKSSLPLFDISATDYKKYGMSINQDEHKSNINDINKPLLTTDNHGSGGVISKNRPTVIGIVDHDSRYMRHCGMIQTNGILHLYFMYANDLPVADLHFGSLFGSLSDPYVYCFQNDAIAVSKMKTNIQTKGYTIRNGLYNASISLYNEEKRKDDPPNRSEKRQAATNKVDDTVNPVWMTEADKKLLQQGKSTKNNVKSIKLSIIVCLAIYCRRNK